MSKFIVDTNFFISGFQVQPNLFNKFANITKKVGLELYIPTYIKNEMRHFLQREVVPHVQVKEVNNTDFQKFLRKMHDHTTNLPQKPDLSVIYLADKVNATVVSSDLKLLETAELIGISTLTDSAFVRYVIEENTDTKASSYLKELESRLFTAEIRYSVESTNRYDPVKRIRKILDSAISVIRTEYEERLLQKSQSDLKEVDGFSMESIQVRELLIEIQSDLVQLEEDFVQGKYLELEDELLSRVREITDSLVDWKLAIDEIEEHVIYNDSLKFLGRLQYLAIICLIENKKLDLARVYMDKLMMILFQNAETVEEIGIDTHLLRMVLLLLSGQLQRINSYFTPAFEDECNQYHRGDVANVIRALILLSVVLVGEKAVEVATDYDYDNIEFINQLGFKYMQLEQLERASLMFEQTFYLSLNNKNRGLCIASLEYLSWVYFAGLDLARATLQSLYKKLIDQFPEIKTSYQLQLQLISKPKELYPFLTSDFTSISNLPVEFNSSLYCIGVQNILSRGKSHPLIRVMNWDIMTRIGIIDENSELADKSSLGTTLHLIEGKYKITKASSHFRKQYDVELLLHIDTRSKPTIIFRSTSGWDLKKIDLEKEDS
ncbi:MAG: hypothetical protein KAS63_07535 [Candidatus Heimdallarchaeota archaeon]|nr:hypothetical protein [Candidatus Heimdallarchaeota archaeon]MCK4955200.1 hypothetical protein [Candidatus Heimdallarchaeota archaeon]